MDEVPFKELADLCLNIVEWDPLFFFSPLTKTPCFSFLLLFHWQCLGNRWWNADVMNFGRPRVADFLAICNQCRGCFLVLAEVRLRQHPYLSSVPPVTTCSVLWFQGFWRMRVNFPNPPSPEISDNTGGKKKTTTISLSPFPSNISIVKKQPVMLQVSPF